MVKKNKPERIFPKLKDDLLKAGEERVRNRLMSPREVRMPKMTELLTRTPSYPNCLVELKLRPEKKK